MKKFKISSFQCKLILFLVPFIPIIINRWLDNDFWFTINQGRYVLEHGFPTKVLFTVHNNLDFIYQSWGTGVIFYIIYNLFGDIGINILLIIIGELTTYFFYKLCYEISEKRELSYFITAITMSIYCIMYLTTRPHIFTSLNLVILLYILEKYSNTKNIKYLIVLPILSLIEANMHGIYFFIILIYTLPYIIDIFNINIKGIKTSNTKNKFLLLIFILMFIVGFINPYTYKTVIYVFSSSGNSILKDKIMELRPITINNYAPMFILMTFILLTYYINKTKTIKFRFFLLVIVSTILALESVKSLNFFLLGAIFPLARTLNLEFQKIENKKYPPKYYITNVIIEIAIILIIIMNYNPQKIENNKAFKYLKNNYSTKNTVYTEFVEGSYIEYLGYKCYIDPRAEIFLKANNHKKDIFKEYIQLDFGDNSFDYKDFLDEYRFDILFVNKKNGLYQLLRKDSYHYKVVYNDDSYRIYEKASE